MNRKQLVILLVLVVVLGAIGLVVHRHNQSSWQGSSPGPEKKLLGDLPVNDVATILIQSGTNELHLVKKDNLWRVKERGDYPANYTEISGFLLKAADLKAAQTEEVGPSQLGRYKLLPPGPGTNTALLVELRDANGKVIRSLLLGKQHMRKSKGRPSPMGEFGDEGFPDGRYLMVGTGSKTLAVISDPLSNIEPKPDQWLNKDFFKVEKVRSVSVAFPVATNSWKLTRDTETAEWKLAEAKPGEQLDSAKASGVSNPFSSPTFNDIATDVKPEVLGFDKPTVVTLDTFDNFTYTIKVGPKTNEICPLTLSVSAQLPKERAPGKDEKAEDKDKLDKDFKEKQKQLEEKLTQEKGYEDRIYLVSAWTVDPLLKERSQLLVEKKEEPKKEEAAKTDTKEKPGPEPPPKEEAVTKPDSN